MRYIPYSSEQYFFDRVLQGITTAIKYAWKALVYFPQLFSGYYLAGYLLNKQANGIAWCLLTLLFAFLFYQLIFFLKGLLTGLKTKRNFWWAPVFVFCLLYTCVLPVILLFGLLHHAAFYCSPAYADLLTWAFACAAGIYLYSRYAFLQDSAPKAALWIYKTGINIVA